MSLLADTSSLAPGKAASQRQAVRIWLLIVAALVLVMIGVGGATRLTGSGLSITEWKPIMGALPPLSDADWQDAFDKYRQIPQYREINKGMSLAEFKTIFWWEWGHRLLGRLIGIVFAVPLFWFWWTGSLSRDDKWKFSGLLVLGGLQGLMGWYMVMSGLVDRVSVSHYRLAAHLGLAILIFGFLVWIASSMGRREDHRITLDTVSGLQRWLAVVLVVAVFLQIELGALVAGLKAGLTYNTWPLMDGRLVPSGLVSMTPWWINPFENITMVQFNHRIMAYVVTALAVWHTVALWRTADDDRVITTAALLLVAILAQAALGIWTLLAVVPVSLGVAHQVGAAVVFAIAVWHLRRMLRP